MGNEGTQTETSNNNKDKNEVVLRTLTRGHPVFISLWIGSLTSRGSWRSSLLHLVQFSFFKLLGFPWAGWLRIYPDILLMCYWSTIGVSRSTFCARGRSITMEHVPAKRLFKSFFSIWNDFTSSSRKLVQLLCDQPQARRLFLFWFPSGSDWYSAPGSLFFMRKVSSPIVRWNVIQQLSAHRFQLTLVSPVCCRDGAAVTRVSDSFPVTISC